MSDFSKGAKVIWRGEEFEILKTYEQPMVQMVNVDGFVRSVPLSQLIADVMRELAPKEPPHER